MGKMHCNFGDVLANVWRIMQWPLGDDKGVGRYEPDRREANIIRHYHEAFDLGRINYTAAIERCVGDIRGRNYHTQCVQR